MPVQTGDAVDSHMGKTELDKTEVDIGLQLLGDTSDSDIDPAVARRTLRKIDLYILPLLA